MNISQHKFGMTKACKNIRYAIVNQDKIQNVLINFTLTIRSQIMSPIGINLICKIYVQFDYSLILATQSINRWLNSNSIDNLTNFKAYFQWLLCILDLFYRFSFLQNYSHVYNYLYFWINWWAKSFEAVGLSAGFF